MNNIDMSTRTTVINQENVLKFENLLLSTQRPGIENLLEWIRKSDFYTAPASSKYHLSEIGGLLQHSLNVLDTFLNKLHNPLWIKHLNKYDKDTYIIITLLHDLCKANFYVTSYRNTKDEHGKWIQVPYYTIDDQLPYGHGEKSVMLILQFVRLTMDEMMAIRWHMGFSQQSDMTPVSQAFTKFPLALALSESDSEATFLLEVERDVK